MITAVEQGGGLGAGFAGAVDGEQHQIGRFGREAVDEGEPIGDPHDVRQCWQWPQHVEQALKDARSVVTDQH